MKNVKVALIGTPNVGKSTIYNTLTHNQEQTAYIKDNGKGR